MVEKKFVMPANAGIQVRFRFNFQNRLDSGFRRNDGNKKMSRSTKSNCIALEPVLTQFDLRRCFSASGLSARVSLPSI